MVIDTINLQYTTIKDPLPNFIYEGLKEFSANANGYRPQPTELKEMLSAKWKIPADNIYILAGADEGIQTFARLFGKKAYVFTPTYIVYSDVKTFGGELTEIYSVHGSEFLIDPKKYVDATLIYLANPNNPSGVTSKDTVIQLIKNNPNAVVVIDEAYGDFAPELSVIDQVKIYSNLAVLKSFSKGYGMAGNRVGFVASNHEIISKVSTFTQWANVSYLSVGAAILALKNENYFKKMRDDVAERREDFIRFLKKDGFKYLPSKINAVLIQLADEKEGTEFFEFLTQNNIIASHGNGNSNIGLTKAFVRIAIGTRNQMEYVKQVISKFRK